MESAQTLTFPGPGSGQLEYTFLKVIVQPIPGWLEDYAALRTMDLLAWQNLSGNSGPLLEIGVFAGKYLSILLRYSGRHPVVGIDTFQYVDQETVLGHLNRVPGNPTLIKSPSTSMSSQEILDLLGGSPRFISVDGSHEMPDVVWDLGLSDKLLSDWGVVAVDDFLNPMTLGVNEGVNRFFSTPRNLAPFFYTANKLFLCRPHRFEDYIHLIDQWAKADVIEPRSKWYRESVASGRQAVETSFYGNRVLFIP